MHGIDPTGAFSVYVPGVGTTSGDPTILVVAGVVTAAEAAELAGEDIPVARVIETPSSGTQIDTAAASASASASSSAPPGVI